MDRNTYTVHLAEYEGLQSTIRQELILTFVQIETYFVTYVSKTSKTQDEHRTFVVLEDCEDPGLLRCTDNQGSRLPLKRIINTLGHRVHAFSEENQCASHKVAFAAAGFRK